MRRLIALLLLTFPLAAAGPAVRIPDIAVVDQDGNRLRFHSDLVKGKVVAMNFIFTRCTTVCTPMGANFAALQKLLGNRKDVTLISISIDPAHDTPARLKAWRSQFRVAGEWTLVTGAPADVDALVKALGVFNGKTSDHSPVAMLGDDAAGRWTRVGGLVAAPKLASMLDDLTRARMQEASRR